MSNQVRGWDYLIKEVLTIMNCCNIIENINYNDEEDIPRLIRLWVIS